MAETGRRRLRHVGFGSWAELLQVINLAAQGYDTEVPASEEADGLPPPRALFVARRQVFKISKNEQLQDGGIGHVRRTEICTCHVNGGTYKKSDRSRFGHIV